MSDKRFDVPFPMPAALEENIRQGQMAICISKKLPKIWPVPIGEDVLSLVGYGPSLEDTWQDIKHPIMSMSGSHDFLIERGIIPDYHCDMDPRPHKVSHILHPHKDVQYLMASVCHPFTWSILKDYKLKTWHVVSGKNTKDWLSVNDPRTVLVAGGSTIGLASIHVGGLIGFRHFEIFGMDGCWKDNNRHAGPHYGHSHNVIEWSVGDLKFNTSKIMMNANVELLNMLRNFPFFAVLHGDGLQQAMLEEVDLPNAALHGTPKADLVRTAKVEIKWTRDNGE
jgi:hypothetical protein